MRARLVDAARALGGLDLLVNNASELGVIGPLMDFDVQRFGRVFPVNVGAPIALIQLAVPLLAERRGLIVNITSDAAHGAYPGWGPYGASKAALELLTRTLATELAEVGRVGRPRRSRRHADAHAPGGVPVARTFRIVRCPEVTVPFWNWLFDQDPDDVRGERFAAQQEDARWLQQA